MPLTVASGVNMPALCVAEALGTPIPDGPLPFEDIAMVRFFQERFFSFDDIEDLLRHAAEIAS
jgi:carbamoyl-phosphate synthase large subunit